MEEEDKVVVDDENGDVGDAPTRGGSQSGLTTCRECRIGVCCSTGWSHGSAKTEKTSSFADVGVES